jgi:N utilization substance protein B
MSFKTTKQRSRARVVQALYQYLLSKDDIFEIEKQFINQKKGRISKKFFSYLFINILENIQLLDDLIKPTINLKSKTLGPVEQAILYLGSFELKFTPEVPCKVIINEAIELAKIYGAENSYKIINKSLDQLSYKIRKDEITN